MTKRGEPGLAILPQPNDTTCGPTCLHAVYRYYGDRIPLSQVIADIPALPSGGTLAVTLARHALRRGYRAEIFTYNLQVFDPTWFAKGVDLPEKLRAQVKRKPSKKLAIATEQYLDFLELGGRVRHAPLTGALIRKFLSQGTPILTGLNATYLYGCAREYNDDYDDVRGQSMGHFVLLSGHDGARREVHVADPLADNPGFGRQYYVVGLDRLIGAILLGIVTYDANLLIISKKRDLGDEAPGVRKEPRAHRRRQAPTVAAQHPRRRSRRGT